MLTFINVISTRHLSAALFKELRMALSSCRKKPVVSAGRRDTAPRGGPKVYLNST